MFRSLSKRAAWLAPCLFLCLLLLTAASAKAGLVVGSNGIGNCYPFSCFAFDGGTTYQEVYNSSAFPGAMTISSLSFFGQPDSVGNGMDNAKYIIELSTTSSSVGDGYPLTVGTDNQVFGAFTVSGSMPSVLTFTGTPFLYDPINGNLLMQVTVDSVTSTCGEGYCSFFEADDTTAAVSRTWTGFVFGSGQGDGALVTGFDYASAIPEPGSLSLIGCGLIGLGVFFRRRR